MRRALQQIEPIDGVLALALTMAMQAEIWAPGALGSDTDLTDRPLLAALSIAISLPLVVRRSFPWATAIVALGAEVVQAGMETPPDGVANLLAVLVVAYSLGRYTRPPAGFAGGILIAATAFWVGEDAADHVFVLVVLGAAWVAGLVMGRRTADLGDLEVRRLEATRAGAEEERLRIARELHDVVAHRVSMIVVQSQLADTLLDQDPAAARTAIGAVEDAGREALVELRSILGLLHDEAPAVRTPRDTDLSRLDELVGSARAGGLPVSLEIVGPPRTAPPAVSLAAFRIVQESLTNVVKHAESAATRVRLEFRPGAVALTIENDGRRLADVEPGFGLGGMSERAHFVGGTVTAAPVPDGGFRVHAVLPTPGVEP